jgi:hypothetical protein
MRTMTSDQHSIGVPKRRQKHHSYDESVDEPAKLLEEEAVDVEEAAPLEDNESVGGRRRRTMAWALHSRRTHRGATAPDENRASV